MSARRLLTFEDLTNFYLNKYKNSVHFDASKTGEPIVVQTEGKIIFETDEEKDLTDGLTAVRLQACHTDINLNKSSVSYDVMKDKFLPTFKNRPILGYIHEVNNEPHFYGHNMHVEETDNGEELVYDEIPVGIIPETNNSELVYDEENEHYNVFVDGYIFNEYTKAAQILEREEELNVSVELSLSKFSYNAKDKVLEIEDGYFSGVTILGKNPDGSIVKPGMEGSNIKLKDFSESNNSLFSSILEDDNEKLIETLEKLNTTLSSITINNQADNTVEENSKEGGSEESMNKFEELIQKYNVTVEEVTFDYEGLSDEELEAKFEEAFGEKDPEESSEENSEVEPEANLEDPAEGEEGGSEEPVVEPEDSVVESEEPTESEENPEVKETEACGGGSGSGSKKKKKNSLENGNMELSFEISHDEIRYALYNLIEQYDELDNDWYYISAVYDDKFIMEGWNGNIYGQKYTKDGDNIALEGERYKLFAEYVTESEKAELDSMRANYAELVKFKEDTENAQLHSQREAILTDEKYSVLTEKETDAEGNEKFKNEAYEKLVSEMDNYSLVDLEKELKSVFADYVINKGQFSANTDVENEKPVVSKKTFTSSDKKKPSRYGNLFSK